MWLYIAFAYIHIVSAICWVGFILFWFLVLPPLTRSNGNEGSRENIQRLEAAPWPPPGLPGPVRIHFLHLGLLFMAALAVSGGVLLYLRGFTIQEITSGNIFKDGLGLVGLIKVMMAAAIAWLTWRRWNRKALQITAAFILTLVVISISVILIR